MSSGTTNTAHLVPFKPGHPGLRRSKAVDRALTKARGLTPEGIDYCAAVMRDPSEDTRLRLRAAEIILHHGLPREGAASRRDIIGEGIQSLRVEFVRADGSTVSFNEQQPPGFIEVPFAVADCDATVIKAVDNEEKA